MIVDYNKALDDARFLFLRSPYHKDYTPDEHYAYLVAPCKKDAIRLYYRNNRPVGLVTWCWFEPDKAEEFLNFKYLPVESDYEKRPDTQLWGIELIAPYGDGARVFKAIKKEHANVYGEEQDVRWRRATDPFTVHKKRFK